LFFFGEGDEDFYADEKTTLEFDELWEIGEQEMNSIDI
jgi:hypothetical protein